MSTSIFLLAQATLARGDGEGALQLAAELVERSRRMALADPRNAVRRRDLSVALGLSAQIAMGQGDLSLAADECRESLDEARNVAALDPTSAQPGATSVRRWMLRVGSKWSVEISIGRCRCSRSRCRSPER